MCDHDWCVGIIDAQPRGEAGTQHPRHRDRHTLGSGHTERQIPNGRPGARCDSSPVGWACAIGIPRFGRWPPASAMRNPVTGPAGHSAAPRGNGGPRSHSLVRLSMRTARPLAPTAQRRRLLRWPVRGKAARAALPFRWSARDQIVDPGDRLGASTVSEAGCRTVWNGQQGGH